MTCKHCHTETNNKVYCSRRCAGEGNRKVKYDNTAIDFLKINVGFMNIKTIAQKLNVTDKGLRREISKLRRLGVEIAGGLHKHYA